MNAAFLLLSSAALAGADAAPPAAPPATTAPPVVISGGAGCTNCGAPAVSYGGCDSCCSSGGKVGLLDRLKGRLGGRKHGHGCGCEAAPSCCAPAPTCDTCNTCSSGCGHRANLCDTLKARWGGRKKHNGPCCNPCGACDSCGGAVGAPGAPVYGAPPAGGYYNPAPGTGAGNPPKEMPKPKDNPKPKTSSIVPPSGTTLTGSTSPY